MKKRIFTILIALVAMISLVACGSDKEKSLDAPELTLTGNVLSWTSVTNAEKYVVYQGSTEKGEQATTSYTITEATAGSYVYKVTAVASGYKSATSNTIEYVVKGTLATPTISLNATTGVVSWNAITNAGKYIVNVNGTDLPEQTATSYTVSTTPGTYVITVKAVPSNVALHNSSLASNSVTHTVGTSQVTTYDVTFDGATIEKQTVNEGAKATAPATPKKPGFEFIGWYKESTLTNVFDFTTETINANTVVYAKWNQVIQGTIVYSNDFSEATTIATEEVEDGLYYVPNKAPANAANISTVIENGKLVVKDTDTTASNYTYLVKKLENGIVNISFDISGTTTNGSWSWVTFTGMNGKTFDIRTTGTGTMGYRVNGGTATGSLAFSANIEINVNVIINTLTGSITFTMTNGINTLSNTVETGMLGFNYVRFCTADTAADRNLSVDNLCVGYAEASASEIKTTYNALLDAKYATYTEADYNSSKWITLTSAYNTGVADIEAATSVDDIKTAYNDAITAMAAVQTKAQEDAELAAAKEIALANLETEYNTLVADPEYANSLVELAAAYEDAKALINDETVLANIADQETAAIALINAVKKFEKLPTPTNLAVSDGILTWDAVENAVGYVVTVDGMASAEQVTREFTLPTEIGSYEITVTAIANPADYKNSIASTVYEYSVAGPLSTPEITIVNGVATWEEVSGAEGYLVVVTKDGSEIYNAEINTTSYTFPTDPATYVISIIAKGDGTTFQNSSAGTDTLVILAKLSTPSNVKVEDGKLVWDAVENAVSYIVYVDGTANPVSTNEFSLATLEDVAAYTLTVVAVADGENYVNSLTSSEVEYVVSTTLSAPQVVVNKNVIAWEQVDNATKYIVTIDGVDQAEQTALTYTLTATEAATYVISVKAIADGKVYLNSVKSKEYSIVASVKTSQDIVGTLDFNKGIITAAGDTFGYTTTMSADGKSGKKDISAVTYNGTSYTSGVKFDSKGHVTFTLTKAAEVKFVFGVYNADSTFQLLTGDFTTGTAKWTSGKHAISTEAYFYSHSLTAGTYTIKQGSKESALLRIEFTCDVEEYSYVATAIEDASAVATAKTNAIASLNSYQADVIERLNETRMANVEAAIEAGTTAINNATSSANVTKALNDAKAAIDALLNIVEVSSYDELMACYTTADKIILIADINHTADINLFSRKIRVTSEAGATPVTYEVAEEYDLNFILDLNGFKINNEVNFNNYHSVLKTNNGTINVVIIDSSENKTGMIGAYDDENAAYCGVLIEGNSNVNVTMIGITLVGYAGGLYTNGSTSKEVVIAATNCSFIGTNVIDSVGAYLPGNANCSFTNCTFTGSDGAYIKSGTYMFDDCTFIATGAANAPEYYGNGFVPNGNALTIDSAVGYVKTLNITLNNCTFNSANGNAIHEVSTYKNTQTPVSYAEVTITGTCTLEKGAIVSENNVITDNSVK